MTQSTNTKPFLKYFKYCPNYTQEYGDDIYAQILPTINGHSQRYQFSIYGKILTSNRKSCVYSDNPKKLNGIGYKKTPIYKWEQSPVQIRIIRTSLELEFKSKIDYVLVHIYEHRGDYIGWHNDKESMNNQIFSLSLGMTRNFQIKRKKVLVWDQKMVSGDLMIMYKGFQQEYMHRVPKISFKDYKQFLLSKELLTKGRHSFKSLDVIIEDNEVDTKRINLTIRRVDFVAVTFRSFD